MLRFKRRILAVSVCLIPWCCPMVAHAHRQYDPGKRRFVQRDPLNTRNSMGAGYQDGMALFLYVSSNPVNRFDPSGLTYCGKVVCHCSTGDSSVPFHGDSWLVVPVGAACITLPWAIHCRGPCGDTSLLSHECCHHCHWRRCPPIYILHAIFDICYNPANQISHSP